MSEANVAYRIRLMSGRARVHTMAALVAKAYTFGILNSQAWPPQQGSRCLCELPVPALQISQPPARSPAPWREGANAVVPLGVVGVQVANAEKSIDESGSQLSRGAATVELDVARIGSFGQESQDRPCGA